MRQISTETETEDEDMMPDLDRQSAAGSAVGVGRLPHVSEEETLATSSDSLASLIPPEKKHSMQVRFLKVGAKKFLTHCSFERIFLWKSVDKFCTVLDYFMRNPTTLIKGTCP